MLDAAKKISCTDLPKKAAIFTLTSSRGIRLLRSYIAQDDLVIPKASAIALCERAPRSDRNVEPMFSIYFTPFPLIAVADV